MNFTINLTDRELCLYFLSERVVRIFKMFPFGKIFITSLKVHVALKWWTLEFQGGLGDLECSFASEHASIFHLLICVFCMVFCALFFHLSLFCAGYFWKLLKPHQKFSGPLLLYLHKLYRKVNIYMYLSGESTFSHNWSSQSQGAAYSIYWC